MFFFHSAIYNHKMSLSKLQKLYPSAIDKCAVVFVPPLACEKRRNIGALGPPLAIENRRNWGVFLTPVRNLQTRAAFIAPFTIVEIIDDNQKKFIPQLAIDIEYFQRVFANPCTM